MKIKCLEKEITGYKKAITIEHQGTIYRADLFYDSENGYELEFRDENGKLIDWPEWADKYDNGQRSLDYDLDEAGGFWEYVTDPMKQEIEL
jgi:hypothetical protein